MSPKTINMRETEKLVDNLIGNDGVVFNNGLATPVIGYTSYTFHCQLVGLADKPTAIYRATANAARRARSSNPKVKQEVCVAHVPFVGTVALTRKECARLQLTPVAPVDYQERNSPWFSVTINQFTNPESSIYQFGSYEDAEAWLAANLEGYGEVIAYKLEDAKMATDRLSYQDMLPTKRMTVAVSYSQFII